MSEEQKEQGVDRLMPSTTYDKPKCKLIGLDSNVFVLAGAVKRCLRKAGLTEQSDEFFIKLKKCHSYDEALLLMQNYVDAF